MYFDMAFKSKSDYDDGEGESQDNGEGESQDNGEGESQDKCIEMLKYALHNMTCLTRSKHMARF